MNELYKQLAAPMDFKWRIQSVTDYNAICVAYIDARQVADRLNDVLGIGGWSDSYQEIKGNVYCTITIHTGDVTASRSDCGSESQVEKEKGESSDAFKRAAVKFGVGRFLYSMKIMKLKVGKYKNGKNYPVDNRGNLIFDGDTLTAYCNSMMNNNIFQK